MSLWRITLLLANWEFRRYFKWKSQLVSWGIGVLIMIGIAAIGPRLVARSVAESTVVGVIGTTPFDLPSTLGVTWRHGEEAELRKAFEAEEIGALLALHTDSAGTLESHTEGGWVHSVQNTLNNARRESRLVAHGLERGVLDDLNASFELERIETKGEGSEDDDEEDAAAEKPRASKWDRIIALSMLGFMFGGVFMGTALLFTGITSEKQQLVTEQIVAAVPPQTWIDGKILGTGARSLITVLEMVLWSLLGMAIWKGFVNPDFAGLSQVSPLLLLAIGVLATFGFVLWYCFFAAISASIDDPNTSARGMLLLLPMLGPALAVPAYFQPDGILAIILSLFPPSATMVLSVRLSLTDVPAWQFIVAVLAMGLSIALLRRAAGKVFAMAILMRGKEPTWREMWRAARKG